MEEYVQVRKKDLIEILEEVKKLQAIFEKGA
jgi:hypothetical protein